MGKLRKIDAFEDHRQAGTADLNARDALLPCRKPESPGFHAFKPDRKAVTVPIKYLHERVVAIQENEQMTGKRIGIEFVANDADQAVERFSHVDRRRAKGNTGVGRYRQHEARAVKSSAMYCGEASVNRRVTP